MKTHKEKKKMDKNYYYDYDFTDALKNLVGANEATEERIIHRLLDNEEEFIPLIKKYLVKYLDSVLENPSELIGEAVEKLIKEKDSEIEELKKRIDFLEKRVDILTSNNPSDCLNGAETWISTNDTWKSNIYTTTAGDLGYLDRSGKL